MSDLAPPPLRGLWRRDVITTPGHSDATTQVRWLQTRSWYVDIRAPADRPSPPGVRGFSDFTAAELVQLAAMQGFAGQLSATDQVCLWRRDLDYQPPSPTPDEAAYRLDGPVMVEDGLHADYQEIWRRAPESDGPCAAFALQPQGAGLLVVAGDCFMEIEDRATPLPPGETLAAIVDAELAAGRRAAAEACLSLRICYGRIRGGRRPWEILLSTLPWLEGETLLGPETRYTPGTGGLTTVVQGRRLDWSLLDASISAEALVEPLNLRARGVRGPLEL